MTPDFDKIQAGMANGLNKTTKIQKENAAQNQEAEQGISYRQLERRDLGTGVAGRSSVGVDHYEKAMLTLKNNYAYAAATNELVDRLLDQGYSLEDAVAAVHGELGAK